MVDFEAGRMSTFTFAIVSKVHTRTHTHTQRSIFCVLWMAFKHSIHMLQRGTEIYLGLPIFQGEDL